jgi:threonine/homoserine/homoserine lactone efflux protein
MASALGDFIQAAAIGFTAAVSPGPFQTYLISESLAGGWKRGAPVAFAPLISDAPIILFSLFVLNLLPDSFLRVVRIAGGLFALYLAWNLFKRWREIAGESGAESGGSGQHPVTAGLWRGAIANFLSPGPYLFWGLVNGPLLLSALRQSTWQGLSFLFGFYAAMVASLLGIALIFTQARRLGPRLVRGLLLLSIFILVGFGGLLLKQGIFG